MKVLLFAMVLFFSIPAFAQSNDELAQKHFQTGAEWYAQGEYAKAIVEFLKGYNLSPDAMFLYNISLSYAKMDNIDEALSAAERASREGGLPNEVELRNQSRIRAFRISTTSRAAASAMSTLAQAKDPAIEEPKPVEESGFGALGWTGVALTTVGAGMVVGSLLVNAPLAGDIEQLEREAQGGDFERFSELKSSIESDQAVGQVLLFAGAGVGALGLTLLIIELMSDETPTTTGFLSPTSDGFSVFLTTHF